MAGQLLDIRNLKTYFETEDGLVPAVDGVSLRIQEGQTLGIVGESGCGKSVTALSIMRLVPVPPGFFAGGEIFLKGEDLLKKTEDEMQEIRGNDVSMIFQEPMISLNPVLTCGYQIAEAIETHQDLSEAEATLKAIEMLGLVGIPSPEQRADEYPHQLSGGMRQRVMIAMALSCNPKLLIADEPTTALDVTIQAQILRLMRDVKEKLSMAVMLITHDLGIVAEMAERVVVMYAGKVIEESDVKPLFKNPLHPYTIGLLKSIPRLDVRTDRLNAIEGLVPSPYAMPEGCRFNPRCRNATDRCRSVEPPLIEVDNNRKVACWRHIDTGR